MLRENSTRRFVCWILVGLNVFPLIRAAVISNLLHPVGHENVEALGIVLDIAKNYLTICVKYLCNLVQLKLFANEALILKESRAVVSSSQGTWPEIAANATAHARKYLAIWPAYTIRKRNAEIKQMKIERLLVYREQVPGSGLVLESFLANSCQLLFVNISYLPYFSPILFSKLGPYNTLYRRGLTSNICIPTRFCCAVAEEVNGELQVPQSFEEKKRIMYYLACSHLQC